MIRSHWRPALVAALASACMLVPGAPAQANYDPVVDLRVLTPNRVLDQGRSYVLPGGKTRMRTTPGARCLGSQGTGARVTFPWRSMLGALRGAVTTRKSLRPLRLADDQGFGPGICSIGGHSGAGTPGKPYWGVIHNLLPTEVGADQARVRNGDEALFYLTPTNGPSPRALRLNAPARTKPGRVSVRVRSFGCRFDENFAPLGCGPEPAAGARVRGGNGVAVADDNGVARVRLDRGNARLVAVRGRDIRSAPMSVCVRGKLNRCPRARGKVIIGTNGPDRIRGTRGNDVIRARGGNDVIDVRPGGRNRVHCGSGRDRVIAKRGQRLELKGCQRVIRR